MRWARYEYDVAYEVVRYTFIQDYVLNFFFKKC